jgi:hypothetical protein
MKKSKATLPFEQTNLKDFYLRELYWLAFQLVKYADAVFESTQTERETVYLSSKVNILDLVYSVLSYAAKIHELLYPPKELAIGATAKRLFAIPFEWCCSQRGPQ